MDGDEALHLAIERGELGLDRVELTARVELAAQRVAHVVNTSGRTMRDIERATARAAERAACVSVGARGRREVARASAGVDERRELAIVEQIRGDTGATCAAIVVPHRPGLSRGARRTRRDGAKLRHHGELAGVHLARESALFVVDRARDLVTQAPAQRDQLVRARHRLADLDQQALDANQHLVKLAPSGANPASVVVPVDRAIVFDPAGIAAMRTSVERVLGRVPTHPYTSAEEFAEYWREATALHGNDDLALRLAEELPVGSFGRASYAFASSATIGDAFQAFRRDAQRLVSGWSVELGRKAGTAELVMRGPDVVWPVIEFMLGVLALRCQQLPEPPVAISRVLLPRARPSDPVRWQRLFTVMPEFGAGHGALMIDAALLGRPLRTADASVRQALGSEYTESIVDQVRAHVREWIREAPEADEVARALGLSTRTLQRRLGEEGTSFRDVVLAVKIDVAKQLLEQPQLSIAEVANAVGFARVPAFSRAFSQRTGMTPTTFRTNLGGSSSR